MLVSKFVGAKLELDAQCVLTRDPGVAVTAFPTVGVEPGESTSSALVSTDASIGIPFDSPTRV